MLYTIYIARYKQYLTDCEKLRILITVTMYIQAITLVANNNLILIIIYNNNNNYICKSIYELFL